MLHERILHNISRFIELNEAEKHYFFSILKPRTYRRRQYLLQAGDVCKYETYIIQGCVRVYYVDDNGFEHNIMFGIEDWWISDFHSLLTQTPAQLNIEALEATEVYHIDKNSMDALFMEVPKFERYFRIMLQNAFISHQQRILQTISLPAEERYRLFVEKYPQFEQRIPQKQIAQYLGITPEFLSKIRAKAAGKK
ncbi:MAG: Crp/Fnr family transcriptional regulator [Saprospiraceae bacterium]